MDILDIVNQKAQLSINYEELLIFNSALNEICNGIDVFEFDTRIGVTKDQVVILLNQIGSVLDKIESKS
ncbi:hypothetical protein [Stenoxybacter acetivorans]|uniref:hypothetical protein n=1 Tax=Stenoxybacter acetivorans TaxID=422441 RepID=UPI00055BA94A|nr:hypothetical protein [Stenoxybacter acetivorans]